MRSGASTRFPTTTWVAKDARIVIVDDDASNVDLLARMLSSAGYTNIGSTTDPGAALELCTGEPADLLLLDLRMPPPDGFELMAELEAAAVEFPVIVLTADVTDEAKVRALAAGARDFLTKPFDRVEVLLRIENQLRVQVMQRQLRQHNEWLEHEITQRTAEVEQARYETLERLALVAEYRDDDTGEHVRRVGRACAAIAAEMGLEPVAIDLLEDAATLHDVGKIGVPDRILLKPGPLTDEEREQMKLHVRLSERILAGSHSSLLQMAEQVARSHHERWDGGGYPRGLRGEEIPISGRIAAVADVFDALTHVRPYKPAWSVGAAVEEVLAGAGSHFDPDVVDAFADLDHRTLLDAAVAPSMPGARSAEGPLAAATPSEPDDAG